MVLALFRSENDYRLLTVLSGIGCGFQRELQECMNISIPNEKERIPKEKERNLDM